MSNPGRLEHVFSKIPNDRRHRAAIEALRPFLNRADYRMRVRGRGPKTPADTSRFGSVRLSGAQRLSIYFDSEARNDVRRAHWKQMEEAKQAQARAEKRAAYLETALMESDESTRDCAAELRRIPGWLRFLFLPIEQAWARVIS